MKKTQKINTGKNDCTKFRFIFKLVFFAGAGLFGIYLLFHYKGYFKSKSSKIDYLIFCQEYPVSVCDTFARNKIACKYGSDINSWSVHGIWPSYSTGKDPEFCRKTKFDVDVLQPIEAELNTRWYSVYADNIIFWKHEWLKHGTCAVDDTPLKTEFTYFNQGLEWNKKYSIKDILSRQNIIPRDERPYSVVAIHEALVSELGVNVRIACRKQQIIEIRMCFSMDLQLISCDGLPGEECNYNEVYYPKNITKFQDL